MSRRDSAAPPTLSPLPTHSTADLSADSAATSNSQLLQALADAFTRPPRHSKAASVDTSPLKAPTAAAASQSAHKTSLSFSLKAKADMQAFAGKQHVID
jgi:hypothetical protein